ncbi:hypothetical protein ACAW74_25795 [Fibrella sp. WM1]|uniref:hypothetical protein n=1 Tax=Fibrella musci TaxID=3242485 RepID=UPI003522796B
MIYLAIIGIGIALVIYGLLMVYLWIEQRRLKKALDHQNDVWGQIWANMQSKLTSYTEL